MWNRIRNALSKTRQWTASHLQGAWSHWGRARSDQALQADLRDALIDALILADVGPRLAESLADQATRADTPQEACSRLIQAATDLLAPLEHPLDRVPLGDFLKPDIPSPAATLSDAHPAQGPQPVMVMVVGVNGSGKTTTLGKMAWRWHHQGRNIHVIAGDTFRVAAVDQLRAWLPEGVGMTQGEPGQDPASVVYRGLQDALHRGAQTVLIDTAGRLPNKTGLMDALAKIQRVIYRVCPYGQVATLLVLDATAGQHAWVQAGAFGQVTSLSGLILAKMEGTAHGGILLRIAQDYRVPIWGLGVGETAEDLVPFSAQTFAESLWPYPVPDTSEPASVSPFVTPP